MRIIRRNVEMDYTIVMTHKHGDLHVDFSVYEISGLGTDGEIYYPACDDDEIVLVSDIGKAQKFLSGHIKWDGCSNMKFDEQETSMLHFCSKVQAQSIGLLMGALYDLAAEMMHDYKQYIIN